MRAGRVKLSSNSITLSCLKPGRKPGCPTSFKRASRCIDGFRTSSQFFCVENRASSRIALSRHVEIDRAGRKQVAAVPRMYKYLFEDTEHT